MADKAQRARHRMKAPLLCRLGFHSMKRLEIGTVQVRLPELPPGETRALRAYRDHCWRLGCDERGKLYVFTPALKRMSLE